jgi:hypothetical protein
MNKGESVMELNKLKRERNIIHSTLCEMIPHEDDENPNCQYTACVMGLYDVQNALDKLIIRAKQDEREENDIHAERMERQWNGEYN